MASLKYPRWQVFLPFPAFLTLPVGNAVGRLQEAKPISGGFSDQQVSAFEVKSAIWNRRLQVHAHRYGAIDRINPQRGEEVPIRLGVCGVREHTQTERVGRCHKARAA